MVKAKDLHNAISEAHFSFISLAGEPLTYENWENDGPFLVKNDPLRVTLDPGGYWGTSDKNKEDFCMCEKMVSKCPRSVVDQACFMMN